MSERESYALGPFIGLYQAVVTFTSIFFIFIYSALIALVTMGDGGAPAAALVLLVIALCGVSLAQFAYHGAVHRVIRFHRMPYPRSAWIGVGRWSFRVAIVALYWALGWLLAPPEAGLGRLGELVGVALALFPFVLVYIARQNDMLHHGQDYRVDPRARGAG